jgi:hypothetical protein
VTDLFFPKECDVCGTARRSLEAPTYLALLGSLLYFTVRVTFVAWETPPDVAVTVIV